MIETKKISDNPLIIQHKVYSFSNPQETANDVEKAIEVIRESLINTDTFNLLLDFSEPLHTAEYDMAAHKEWAIGFKNNAEITKHIQNTAVVGIDSEKFRGEKQFMEDDTHKWFTDYDEALRWLKSGDPIPSK